MKYNFTLLLLTCFMLGQFVYGQKEERGQVGPDGFVRCSSVEMDKELRRKYPNQTMSKADFERWIAPKVEEYKARVAAGDAREGVITIPVVIHVIHNGDPVNVAGNATSENISYAQAISQIDVLNQDYRRLAGTPGAGTSGYGLGVDTEIEFCLATRDPNGLPTNGVNRVDMGQESWARTGIESTVKPQTIWDPEKYMNMWSVKFTDTTLLGYAQFPAGSGLPGVPGGGTASTDGVVSNYNAFGTIAQNDGSFVMNGTYNLGRTMTHEVGHWLGLRHIWGDSNAGDCSLDDYCDDTPNSDQANFQCNEVTHCESIDMIENYMDYTNDACMDTFTEDQKARMITVMTNAVRRASLVESDGCSAPDEFQLEAALEVTGVSVDCSGEASINVTVNNYGNQNITSINFEYGISGSLSTYTWNGDIAYLASEAISLPAVQLVAGDNNLEATIVNVNGANDANDSNNSGTISQTYTESVSLSSNQVVFELQPDNYGSETSWELYGPNGDVVANGGPYVNNETELITLDWELSNGCYEFVIYDAYSDGICCGYGQGYVKLINEDEVVFEATDFGAEARFAFSIGNMSVNDLSEANAFSVYPNPAKSTINLIGNEDIEAYKVYNTNGQLITEGKNLVAKRQQTVNVSNLKPGVYFVQAVVNGKKQIVKFIKE